MQKSRKAFHIEKTPDSVKQQPFPTVCIQRQKVRCIHRDKTTGIREDQDKVFGADREIHPFESIVDNMN